MHIRKGSVSELEKLWNHSQSNTYKYFINGMKEGNIEFWTVVHDESQLIGELYIFWNSEDKEEANGKNRAYLCALRIKEEYRGKGLSSKLMNSVLERVKDNGFSEVTIGIDNENYKNLLAMYNAWGFKTFVKKQHCDYHYLDTNNNPVKYEEPIEIYLKVL